MDTVDGVFSPDFRSEICLLVILEREFYIEALGLKPTF